MVEQWELSESKGSRGITGRHTSEQFRDFARGNTGANGGGFYSSGAGFGEHVRRTGVALRGHDNARASTAPAFLYGRFDGAGNFLKWGISQNPATRYSSTQLGQQGFLRPYRSWPRSQILDLERRLTERFPGPLNFEPWAGVRNPSHPNYTPR